MSGPFSLSRSRGGESIYVIPVLAPPDAFAVPEIREVSKPSGFRRGLIYNRFHDDSFLIVDGFVSRRSSGIRTSVRACSI